MSLDGRQAGSSNRRAGGLAGPRAGGLAGRRSSAWSGCQPLNRAGARGDVGQLRGRRSKAGGRSGGPAAGRAGADGGTVAGWRVAATARRGAGREPRPAALLSTTHEHPEKSRVRVPCLKAQERGSDGNHPHPWEGGAPSIASSTSLAATRAAPTPPPRESSPDGPPRQTA